KPYRERIEVLPMGLDLEPYIHPSAAHSEKAAEIARRYPGPIWLTCGRLTYYKGLLNAIRALKKVPGTLIMVGSGPELDALRAEAARQRAQAELDHRIMARRCLEIYKAVVRPAVQEVDA